MKIKLWLDDVRRPRKGWTWAKTVDAAKEILLTQDVSHVSFDHDLGEGQSGYDLATWIEGRAANGCIHALAWYIHSANPVGRQRIHAAMRSAERFWNK